MERVNKIKELQRYEKQLKALESDSTYREEQKQILKDFYTRKIIFYKKEIAKENCTHINIGVKVIGGFAMEEIEERYCLDCGLKINEIN